MKITPSSRTSVTLPTSTRKTTGWWDEAACKGMDVEWFFDPRTERHARKFCLTSGCPALLQCRAHALDVPEVFGVFGGMTEDERRRELRRRRDRRGRGLAS